MAGDWIKMRVGLTTNPRVMRIAECLLADGRFMDWAGLSYGMPGYPPQPQEQQRAERHAALRVTRYVTVTALLRWWGYANEHAKGEFIAGLFPEDVDEITGVPGFAAAIEAAGWVEFDASAGARLPNFSEHNTSAGERSSGAERQKRYREKHREADEPVTPSRDVTRDVTVTRREEKRREEEKQKKPAQARPSSKCDLQAFLTACAEAGEDPIPADDAVFAYADRVGLPREYVGLAWGWFKRRYAEKKQAGVRGWRQTFRNAVEDNWPKLWFADDAGGWGLTTAGKQAQRAAQ